MADIREALASEIRRIEKRNTNTVHGPADRKVWNAAVKTMANEIIDALPDVLTGDPSPSTKQFANGLSFTEYLERRLGTDA